MLCLHAATLLISLMMFSFSSAPADDGKLRNANKRYEESQFTLAAFLYRKVIREEPRSRNADIASFNLGNTLFRSKRYAEAGIQFRKTALMDSQPERFRADARFNAGNTYAQLSLLRQEKEEKTALLQASLKEYRSALLMKPDDQESKINYEIILRRLQSLTSFPPKKEQTPDTPSAGSRSAAASNILLQSAKEEGRVLRNSYHAAPKKNNALLQKDW
ncbi:MAG: hypothetical protein C1941_07035 [Prosthecochloris sp.]|uniref:Tetratricopeptide TPR_2 repeat protein n=1 Tax=Chlorobium phaeobacteroides (strain BS1) TaxID=331678 RepID=B3EPB2_CHLPB|nr:hypothetical protein [Chlorobium phaeobacteroides]NEX14432.1 hypothetical protein [Prosthecochloris sp.]